MPASGVWVFRNRRWVCAASRANRSACGSVSRSSQGDSSPSGAGRSGVWKTRSAQTICIQVVPCFDRVLMTMSPSAERESAHRPLSSSGETKRRAGGRHVPRPNQRARRLEPNSPSRRRTPWTAPGRCRWALGREQVDVDARDEARSRTRCSRRRDRRSARPDSRPRTRSISVRATTRAWRSEKTPAFGRPDRRDVADARTRPGTASRASARRPGCSRRRPSRSR